MAKRRAKFRVNCFHFLNGKLASEWSVTADSYEHAKHHRQLQMSPSTDYLVSSTGVNRTRLSYVNTTIVMLGVGGRETVMDERIHPLAALREDIEVLQEDSEEA